MDSFFKMDVFFFVTTVAVIMSILFLALIALRFLRILKNIEHISEQVALEGDNIRLDLANARADILRGKGRLKSLFGFFSKTAERARKGAHSKPS